MHCYKCIDGQGCVVYYIWVFAKDSSVSTVVNTTEIKYATEVQSTVLFFVSIFVPAKSGTFYLKRAKHIYN